MENAIQLITAFLGSLGFAMLFHVRREKLLLASLGGLLSWGVYLLMGLALSDDVVRYFVASVVVAIYAETMARVVKCPATVFLVTAAVPLIPGGSLYRTMSAFMDGNFTACSHYGLTTMLLAAAIAVGMLFPMSVFQLFRRARTIAACRRAKKCDAAPDSRGRRKSGGPGDCRKRLTPFPPRGDSLRLRLGP